VEKKVYKMRGKKKNERKIKDKAMKKKVRNKEI
jgi:hypothetical protein